jgi:hypothetical protein
MGSIYFKAIYQDYDWCYQKYMIEGLNHDTMAIEANCSKRVIEKWCAEKHRLTQKFRQINTILNNAQHNLLIGSMLGDGHIDKRETQPIFIVSHAHNQKDYLYYKYNILKPLCNIPPICKPACIHLFGDKEYSVQSQYRLCTRIYDIFNIYRNMSNLELLNNLNEYSFSIWMLDDGYIGYDSCDLCIAEYSKNDTMYIQEQLFNLFNIESTLCKDIRYLRFNKKNMSKIIKILLNNIPNDLDIINYKINNKGFAYG